MNDKSYVVLSVGLDARSIDKLNQALHTRNAKLTVVDYSANPDAILINIESLQGEVLNQDCVKRHPSAPVIGLCSNKRPNWHFPQIVCPIDINELVRTVKKVIPEINGCIKNSGITDDKLAKAMAAIESKKVAAKLNGRIEQEKSLLNNKRTIIQMSDELYFDSSRFFLGFITEIVSQLKVSKGCALINCWNGKKVFINYPKKTICTDLTESQIRNLAIAPLETNFVSSKDVVFSSEQQVSERSRSSIVGDKPISLEVFIWNLAVLTSKGRVPSGTSLDERYYLRRWPNVTRIKLPENALNIIAYWSKQPSSINTIRAVFDLPLTNILSVFTAANACGLAGLAKRASDSLLAPEKIVNHEKHGMFGSIINRLRKMYEDVA